MTVLTHHTRLRASRAVIVTTWLPVVIPGCVQTPTLIASPQTFRYGDGSLIRTSALAVAGTARAPIPMTAAMTLVFMVPPLSADFGAGHEVGVPRRSRPRSSTALEDARSADRIMGAWAPGATARRHRRVTLRRR
jgi:hypothetical protein